MLPLCVKDRPLGNEEKSAKSVNIPNSIVARVLVPASPFPSVPADTFSFIAADGPGALVQGREAVTHFHQTRNLLT